MKNVFILIVLLLSFFRHIAAINSDSLYYGSFGKVYIYKPGIMPDNLVLLVSEGVEWKGNAMSLKNELVDRGAMVVDINLAHYLAGKITKQEKCLYPAGDFESLSLYLQRKYLFRDYQKPVLVGYLTGASFVYGTLAQAPANTFKGAIAIRFCPSLKIVKPLCTVNGLKQHALPKELSWYLEPCGQLAAPFIVINNNDDKVCSYNDVEGFIKQVNNAELLGGSNKEIGMSGQKSYLTMFTYAYDKIIKTISYVDKLESEHQKISKTEVQKPKSNMPLIILSSKANDEMPLAFIISGDGGWTSFDQNVASRLTALGLPVLGLDAQKYFWQERTPDETSAEINKILNYYLKVWNKRSFIICGYSFGADIVPFVANRFTAELEPAFKRAVLMSPDSKADFEIHVADMLNLGINEGKYDVVDELKKSDPKRFTIIMGEEEDKTSQRLFKNTGISLHLLLGGHHYNNNYDAITNVIISSFK